MGTGTVATAHYHYQHRSWTLGKVISLRFQVTFPEQMAYLRIICSEKHYPIGPTTGSPENVGEMTLAESLMN